FAISTLRAVGVPRDYSVQRRERCRIVPTRAREHLLARLTNDQCAPERVLVEQQMACAVRAARRTTTEAAVNQSAGARNRDLVENRRVHQLVHEAHLQRLAPADV